MPRKKTKVPKKLSHGEQISVKAENTTGTVKTSLTINSLNFDCLQNVIKYLPIKDRVVAEGVSKQWRYASKSSWGSFKSLNFKQDLWGLEKPFYYQSIENKLKMLESILSRCGNYLTSLNLQNFSYYGQDNNLSKPILKLVKTYCTNLKSFYMKGQIRIDKSSIPTLKVIIINLQSLDVKFDDKVTDEDLKLLFSSCNQFKHFSITAGESITGDFLYFLKHEKIKELGLSLLKSANAISYATQKFENLERLKIGKFDYNFESQSNFEYPKKLKSLCLESYYNDNLNFTSKMTLLTKLELKDVWIKDSLLFQIAKNCSELQYLELDGGASGDATDEGIQALSLLSKLKDLQVTWMADCCITGRSLKHFSSLKTFGVSYLHKLDGKSLCNVLLSCKGLEELSINADFDDEDDIFEQMTIDFFTSVEKFLEQRYFFNNKPLKIVLYNGFVIVNSNKLTDLEKGKLYFEVYSRNYYADSNKSQKVFGTNDFQLLLSCLDCNSYFTS